MGVERNTSRCQTLDMLFRPVNSSILKTGRGKHECMKREQSPERAVKKYLSYELQKQNSLPEATCTANPLCRLRHCMIPCSSTSRQGMGSNDLQIGQNTKIMGSFIKNNTIFNQDI